MIELDRIDKKSAPQKRGALHSLWKGHSCSLLVLLAGLRFGRGIIHDADRRILLFDERVDLVEVLAREEESLFRVAVADVQASNGKLRIPVVLLTHEPDCRDAIEADQKAIYGR